MTAGYNTGLNAFGFEALRDAADIEQALGDRSRAAGYRADASSLKAAINRNLWDPNGPGGPQYTDLLGYDGSFNDYFIDMYQYPLIAFGIAPRDRAAEMLTTADNRMAQLVAQYGYTRAASLSTLWDNPNNDGGIRCVPRLCERRQYFGSDLLGDRRSSKDGGREWAVGCVQPPEGLCAIGSVVIVDRGQRRDDPGRDG